MTVWAVERVTFSGYSLVGLFSSREKAVEYAKHAQGDTSPSYIEYQVFDYEVDEFA